MSLGDWNYVTVSSGGGTINAILDSTTTIEQVSSLIHQVGGASPDPTDPIDIMGWGAGVTQNTTLVRSCFKFVESLYGVFAIMQTSLGAAVQCYAATYDNLGNVSLWKATLTQILNNSVSPLDTFAGTVPSSDTWGLSLLTQYDAVNLQMQLTVATTAAAQSVPLESSPGVPYGSGLFPAVVNRIVFVDSSPISGGVNAGIFSAQLGTFTALDKLDDFDITQIFIP